MLYLAQKNLISQRGRFLLTSISIIISIAALTILTSLSMGIQKTLVKGFTSDSPLTQITVQPKEKKNVVLSLLSLGGSGNYISEKELNEIARLPHVREVYSESTYGNLSSVQLNIIGQSMQSDAMFFALPYNFIKNDLKNLSENEWNNPSSPYPAVISRKLISLYNFTIANSSSLPYLREEDIIGKTITLLPGTSTFIPNFSSPSNTITARIAGFSDKVSLIGVTLPPAVITDLNMQGASNYSPRYIRLYLNVDELSNLDTVVESLEKQGFQAVTALGEIRQLEENFQLIHIGLGLISSIVLIISGLMIINTFLSLIRERRTEIGLLRCLGARKKQILQTIITEAAILGLISGIIGVTIGLIAGFFLNQTTALRYHEIHPEITNLFFIDPILILEIIIFAVSFSLIFALIPAILASRFTPLDTLRK